MNDPARSPQQFGALVRRARKRRALTQQELADKVGLRQETISVIETGNPATRMDTVLALLSALDLELQIAPRGKDWRKDLETDF